MTPMIMVWILVTSSKISPGKTLSVELSERKCNISFWAGPDNVIDSICRLREEKGSWSKNVDFENLGVETRNLERQGCISKRWYVSLVAFRSIRDIYVVPCSVKILNYFELHDSAVQRNCEAPYARKFTAHSSEQEASHAY